MGDRRYLLRPDDWPTANILLYIQILTLFLTILNALVASEDLQNQKRRSPADS